MNSETACFSAKEIAAKFTNEIWNSKAIHFVDQLVDSDVLIHSLLGESRGRQYMKEVIQSWLAGFPDLSVMNENVIGENDLITIQWNAKGTHQGEFKGIKPTGKSVTYSGVTVYRIKDNAIIEYWAYLDMQYLLGQLG